MGLKVSLDLGYCGFGVLHVPPALLLPSLPWLAGSILRSSSPYLARVLGKRGDVKRGGGDGRQGRAAGTQRGLTSHCGEGVRDGEAGGGGEVSFFIKGKKKAREKKKLPWSTLEPVAAAGVPLKGDVCAGDLCTLPARPGSAAEQETPLCSHHRQLPPNMLLQNTVPRAGQGQEEEYRRRRPGITHQPGSTQGLV